METAVSSLIMSAVFSSFLTVRIVKGPWLRNPQYLVLSVMGGAAAMMALNVFSPGAADGFIAGNIAAFAGAVLSILAFDAAIGAE